MNKDNAGPYAFVSMASCVCGSQDIIIHKKELVWPLDRCKQHEVFSAITLALLQSIAAAAAAARCCGAAGAGASFGTCF